MKRVLRLVQSPMTARRPQPRSTSMKSPLKHTLALLILTGILAGADRLYCRDRRPSAPLETLLLEPVEMDSVAFWIPADKYGPTINKSCVPRRNCLYAQQLHGRVEHTKAVHCPPTVALLLANTAADYHKATLPLTILNGWKWEPAVTLSAYESISYDLAGILDFVNRQNSWELASETLLIQTTGSLRTQWLALSPAGKPAEAADKPPSQTAIDAISFTMLRTRDGYPKKRWVRQ